MSDVLIYIFIFFCIVASVVALVIVLVKGRSGKGKAVKKQETLNRKPVVTYRQPEETEYEITPWKAAGNEGEWIAEGRIFSIIRENDHYCLNLRITYEGGRAELDSLIFNHNGVFVIEVKNWSGIIFGDENDHTFTRVKNVRGEYIEEDLDNPLEQAEKAAGLLGKLLRSKGIDVHVEAYVYFVRENFQGDSDRILANVQEIDQVIHTSSGRYYDPETIEAIASWAAEIVQKPAANWISDY